MHRNRKPKRVVHLATCGRNEGVALGAYLIGLERGLRQAGMKSLGLYASRPTALLARTAAKLHLARNFFQLPGVAFLSVLSWGSDAFLFPTCYCAESVVYCFDCWPDRYEKWTSLFQRQRIRTAFFTARASAEYFQRRFTAMRCIWLPEATDPSMYRPEKPLRNRGIDVIEYGRGYKAYHELIVQGLANAKTKHLYQRQAGEILFPTWNGFVEALADSKLSVCFPGSMSYPERAACETVTYRYFESMASRCVLIGRAPLELQDLFGYDPVVEADMADPAGQLKEIIRNVERYQALVDRNFARLREVGTWDARVRSLMEHLRQHGYTI